MPDCCPTSYAGWDEAMQAHKYFAVVCATGQNRDCYSENEMNLGACQNGQCSVQTIPCADEIPIPDPTGKRALDTRLQRPVYRRLVPHPLNTDHRPDAPFVPARNTTVIGEYTAEYKVKGRTCLARLMTIGLVDVPGRLDHFGWELDPRSPLSPIPTPHFSGRWIERVKIVHSFHLVTIKNIGKFVVSVT